MGILTRNKRNYVKTAETVYDPNDIATDAEMRAPVCDCLIHRTGNKNWNNPNFIHQAKRERT